MREGTRSPLFREDPMATAQAMADAGVKAIHCIDLGLPPFGPSPHLSIIKNMHDELGLALYVGGGFKTLQAVENFIDAGASLIVLGSVAYQQPHFLGDIGKKLPGKIAVHIDVKSGHVTIPGYTVVANKTPFDYAEQFLASGVRYIFYSDVGADGLMDNEHLDNLVSFCNRVTARIVCTSEVSQISQIERMANLNIPRLEGIILGRPLYEGRIDLHSAIAMVADLVLTSDEESTMTEM